MAKLNTTVVVRDENSVTHVLGPDSEIPEWAEKAITNPAVWAEAPEDVTGTSDESGDTSTPEAGTGADSPASSEDAPDAGDDEAPADSDAGLTIPPKGGAGSGKDAWREYAIAAAAANGVNIEIPDEATRDDIIEALAGADIPTE